MDDLISRQAAIDILTRYEKSHIRLKGKPILGIASMVIEIQDLPSAQPEIITEDDVLKWCNERNLAIITEIRKKWYETVQQEHTCVGCKHYEMWENEVEYGYNSPCTKCKRRMNDNYEQ